MKRYGTVLVFKKGIDKKAIKEALDSITHVMQDKYWLDDDHKMNHTAYRIEEFDDEHAGGPVWYIP